MQRGQVVILLGRDGDPAQFRPFQFPAGCTLEVSGFIRDRFVSVHVVEEPEPQPPCEDRLRQRRAVCAAYIRELNGRNGRHQAPEGEPPLRVAIEAMCSWVAMVESCTHASALTLAWTGAVRIEALSTFTISVWRNPRFPSSPATVTVEVTSDGIPAITTIVQTPPHVSHPTVDDVVRVFFATGLAVPLQHEFFSDGDQQIPGDGLFILTEERATVRVMPRKRCILCNKHTLDGSPRYNSVYPTGWGHYLDGISICVECTTGFGETERALRVWGAEFRVSVDGYHAPLFLVEFRAPVKVEHTDPAPRAEYYVQCCAVPVESMSIWQHMAHLACDAVDLLLRIARPQQVLGTRKLKSALLGLLSEAILRKILAHLMRAVLPPSRAQIA
jgi:hypothetical protein